MEEINKVPAPYRTIVLCLFFVLLSTQVYGGNWKQIADGIQYKKVHAAKSGLIHLFKIDPARVELDIITAKQFGMANIDAKTMAIKTGALLSINGGFFSPEYASLGLLVQGGREVNRLKWTSWWHIFQIKNGAAEIVSKQDYLPSPELEMAIEAGPRLIVNGGIPPSLKPSVAERSGIGIDNNGEIIIATTEGLLLSLAEFASYLYEAGCFNALNLDGGSSTQIYAKVRGFELNRAGFGPVANGIGVFQR